MALTGEGNIIADDNATTKQSFISNRKEIALSWDITAIVLRVFSDNERQFYDGCASSRENFCDGNHHSRARESLWCGFIIREKGIIAAINSPAQ